jgi:adenosylmethionine-8-amino-7-oxononanoate aminotransferase
MGRVLQGRLQDLCASPWVGDVRGRGLLAGIEFVADKETRRPFPRHLRFAETFTEVALQLGLITWAHWGQLDDGTGDLIMLAPPFTISETQIDDMVTILIQSAERTAAQVQARA